MSNALGGPAVVAAQAHVAADLSLALVILAALLFTIGWRLAVARRYQAHRWVQTAAAGLNAVVVLAWMIRSFLLYLLPGIPSKLGQRAYAVATVHAAVGLIGLALGIFVALRGNELVPAVMRFTRYKPIMRTSYGLYMLATLLGVLVYLITYENVLR